MSEHERLQNCPHCGKTVVVKIGVEVEVNRLEIKKSPVDLP